LVGHQEYVLGGRELAEDELPVGLRSDFTCDGSRNNQLVGKVGQQCDRADLSKEEQT